ncbi:hypothetical protein TNIN_341521 [Trichonephila inaurata madagascariensis]|uniref:Uncharacterized protein n=1 Tax=Trichonephila inaurata madagascariensis TaxID=2747483 RepID=A0A8X6I9Y4_9ARAC|nr:hypothetical protein TNIN_341521 [Trichonephila inaurata madagascariensis]
MPPHPARPIERLDDYIIWIPDTWASLLRNSGVPIQEKVVQFWKSVEMFSHFIMNYAYNEPKNSRQFLFGNKFCALYRFLKRKGEREARKMLAEHARGWRMLQESTLVEFIAI